MNEMTRKAPSEYDEAKSTPLPSECAHIMMQEKDNMQNASAKLSLEDFPVELKLAILHEIPDLETLRCLVHASPDFYGAYVFDRHHVLDSVICNEFDPITRGYLLAIGKVLDFAHNRSERGKNSQLVDTLRTLETMPTSASNRVLFRHRTTLAEIQKTVLSVIPKYSQYAFSKLPIAQEAFESDPTLFLTESRRISRGLYRYQLLCTVFAKKLESHKRGYRGIGITDSFLRLFPHWQVEEIICIKRFMKESYRKLFSKYESERLQLSANDILKYYPDTQNLGKLVLEQSINRFVSQGLLSLQSVFQEPPPSEIMMFRSKLPQLLGLLDMVQVHEDYGISMLTMTPLAEMQYPGDLLDEPNAGWSCKTIPATYGDTFLEQSVLRERGYVFWDKERLERWGLLDSVSGQI